MGHVGSKTGSLGQILQNPCVHFRRHIFSLIIMKLGKNVCLDEILDEFKNGSYRVKNYVTSSNLRKTFIFSPILMKFVKNVCLDEISDEFENGSFRVKK